MKNYVLFLTLALVLSASFYSQNDYVESKPLYSLPKIIEPQKDGSAFVAKKSSEQDEKKPATIKRVQIEETKNTLLATEGGLKKISPNGKQSS